MLLVDILRDPILQGIAAIIGIFAAISAVASFFVPGFLPFLRSFLLKVIGNKFIIGFLVLVATLMVGIFLGTFIAQDDATLDVKKLPTDTLELDATIQVAIVTTQTAQPNSTNLPEFSPMIEPRLTLDLSSTVLAVVAATQTAQPTWTPYPTSTPQPALSPITIIATPTIPPPTPTPDVTIIDASEPWEKDGVAIKLSYEFNKEATELRVKWVVTNGTNKPLLVYRNPEMIKAEEYSSLQELIVTKLHWISYVQSRECDFSDKIVIQPNETLSSQSFCEFKIHADYSKVKKVTVILSGITDNISIVKWKVEVPF